MGFLKVLSFDHHGRDVSQVSDLQRRVK
jgi:suppressor of G2 allele of SKP1